MKYKKINKYLSFYFVFLIFFFSFSLFYIFLSSAPLCRAVIHWYTYVLLQVVSVDDATAAAGTITSAHSRCHDKHHGMATVPVTGHE